MAITALVLLALYSGVAVWMSLRAEQRFARRGELPMQWGLDGKPNAYASRRFAPIAIPSLAGAGVILGAVLAIVAPEQANLPEAQAMAVVAGTGVFGLALYAGYLWAVDRWDRTTSL